MIVAQVTQVGAASFFSMHVVMALSATPLALQHHGHAHQPGRSLNVKQGKWCESQNFEPPNNLETFLGQT